MHDEIMALLKASYRQGGIDVLESLIEGLPELQRRGLPVDGVKELLEGTLMVWKEKTP
jgi:hypothetical protein